MAGMLAHATHQEGLDKQAKQIIDADKDHERTPLFQIVAVPCLSRLTKSES